MIFTKANADTDGRIINQLIENYVRENSTTSIVFPSLGQIRYLSALQFVDGVVGNSSSGLIEVPSFKIGTLNIGDRQKGRLKADSVIDCDPNPTDIDRALRKLYSPAFQIQLKSVKNPYGGGLISERIMPILKATDFKSLLKKSFYNLAL